MCTRKRHISHNNKNAEISYVFADLFQFVSCCGVVNRVVDVVINPGDIPTDYLVMVAGLGRVLDKSTRVQVQVLEKMTSTSTSTGFSKVLEYKYKYLKST